MLFRRLQRMVAGRAFHAKPVFLRALQEVAEAAQKLQVCISPHTQLLWKTVAKPI